MKLTSRMKEFCMTKISSDYIGRVSIAKAKIVLFPSWVRINPNAIGYHSNMGKDYICIYVTNKLAASRIMSSPAAEVSIIMDVEYGRSHAFKCFIDAQECIPNVNLDTGTAYMIICQVIRVTGK